MKLSLTTSHMAARNKVSSAFSSSANVAKRLFKPNMQGVSGAIGGLQLGARGGLVGAVAGAVAGYTAGQILEKKQQTFNGGALGTMLGAVARGRWTWPMVALGAIGGGISANTSIGKKVLNNRVALSGLMLLGAQGSLRSATAVAGLSQGWRQYNTFNAIQMSASAGMTLRDGKGHHLLSSQLLVGGIDRAIAVGRHSGSFSSFAPKLLKGGGLREDVRQAFLGGSDMAAQVGTFKAVHLANKTNRKLPTLAENLEYRADLASPEKALFHTMRHGKLNMEHPADAAIANQIANNPETALAYVRNGGSWKPETTQGLKALNTMAQDPEVALSYEKTGGIWDTNTTHGVTAKRNIAQMLTASESKATALDYARANKRPWDPETEHGARALKAISEDPHAAYAYAKQHMAWDPHSKHGNQALGNIAASPVSALSYAERFGPWSKLTGHGATSHGLKVRDTVNKQPLAY